MDAELTESKLVKIITQDQTNNIFVTLSQFFTSLENLKLIQISKKFRHNSLQSYKNKIILKLAKFLKPLKVSFVEKNYSTLILSVVEYLKNYVDFSSLYNLAYEIISDLLFLKNAILLKLDHLSSSLLKKELRLLDSFKYNLRFIKVLKFVNISIDSHFSTILFNYLISNNGIRKIIFINNRFNNDKIFMRILEAISVIKSLEVLKVGENFLFLNSLALISKIFSKNSCLKRVKLVDNKFEEFDLFTKSFFELISKNKHIISLNYENQEIEEPLFEEISKLIIKSALSQLGIKLANSKINCELIGTIIVNKEQKLQSLDISKSNLGYTFLKQLIHKLYTFKNESLKSINFGRIYLTLDFKDNFSFFLLNAKFSKLAFYDNFTEINKDIYVESIFKNRNITELNLNKSTISCSNFDFLKFTFYSRSLQILSLRECGLTEENLYYFSLAVPDLVSIKSIDLSYNKFTVSSASHICEAISNTKSLQTINLSNNWLGFQSLILILFAILHNSSLQSLIYKNNFFDIDQVEFFNLSEIRNVIKPPKKCRGNCQQFNCENFVFHSLDISFNFINESVFEKLIQISENFKNFEKLIVEDCYISEKYLLQNNETYSFNNLDDSPKEKEFKFVYTNELTQENTFLNQKIPYSLYVKIIEIFKKQDRKIEVIL